MPKIVELYGREILDSRGQPTIEATVVLSDGTTASAQVPSGASRGKHEAHELRDRDPTRFAGKGTRKAVENINTVIFRRLDGETLSDWQRIDEVLIELDGTTDKSKLGANAILAVSMACARALALSERFPLWKVLQKVDRPTIPIPLINILSGGLHGGAAFEIQDLMIVPVNATTLMEALQIAENVHRNTRHAIEAKGYLLTGVADEGGWAPKVKTNREAFEILLRGIELAGYRPGEDIFIAADFAASHFFEKGHYQLKTENRVATRVEWLEVVGEFIDQFPIISIEDPVEEEDWEGMARATRLWGDRCQIVGDDIFVTQPERLHRAADEKIANAALVKPNQVGTLSETWEFTRTAHEVGYVAIASARSGDTEDTFLADLAVGFGTPQIKIGSITRSERLAKYNRLLALESEGLPYAGRQSLTKFLQR